MQGAFHVLRGLLLLWRTCGTLDRVEDAGGDGPRAGPRIRKRSAVRGTHATAVGMYRGAMGPGRSGVRGVQIIQAAKLQTPFVSRRGDVHPPRDLSPDLIPQIPFLDSRVDSR